VTQLGDIRVAGELLAAARAGEERARAQLYALVAPATFGLIRRLMGARAQAEDLFQDTLITMYERLNDYRGEAPFGAWVRRIAVSKCLMYLRSPWHRARLELSGGAEEWLDALTGQGPADAAAGAGMAESLDLERALARLSPTARAVVWLYEVEGYSHEEIGRAFGRTVSFSKSQLARAHRRLRALLEGGVERAPCPLP